MGFHLYNSFFFMMCLSLLIRSRVVFRLSPISDKESGIAVVAESVPGHSTAVMWLSVWVPTAWVVRVSTFFRRGRGCATCRCPHSTCVQEPEICVYRLIYRESLEQWPHGKCHPTTVGSQDLQELSVRRSPDPRFATVDPAPVKGHDRSSDRG